MEVFLSSHEGLSDEKIIDALKRSLTGRILHKVLIIVPDFTRFHSRAGFITNYYYHYLEKKNVQADILLALGTHQPMSEDEIRKMYGDIPLERFIAHNWRNDVISIGKIPESFVSKVSEGLINEAIEVEVNSLLMDKEYDLIISIGQVVPHEVVGMSSHTKNLLVGTGGTRMINMSHLLGALYGMERIMGRDHTPVRKLFDYAFEHFLSDRPLLFVLTVTKNTDDKIMTHGLYISEGRECFNQAVKMAQKVNIDFLEEPLHKCVVYLDPNEFISTWLGNKAIYRTRMAMADDGELIILGKGIERFGEDPEIDQIIRKYGYCGNEKIIRLLSDPTNEDLRHDQSAAAHLIHGSSEERFKVTYAVEKLPEEVIRSVGFEYASYDKMISKYDPAKLKYGFNEVDGERIFYIPDPSLGLWIAKDRFKEAE